MIMSQDKTPPRKNPKFMDTKPDLDDNGNNNEKSTNYFVLASPERGNNGEFTGKVITKIGKLEFGQISPSR